MQVFRALLLSGVAHVALGDSSETNPLGKVFQLIGDLKAKIRADGEVEQKAYEEYARWCRSTSAETKNEIETSTGQKNKLTAKVSELSSDIEVGESKVEELTGAIAKAEAELKSATAIRSKEAEEFSEGEKELMATVDTLERASSVLSKGGSFAQIDTSNLATLLQSLGAITDAAGMAGTSKQKLLALVQAHEEDGDGELGAPAASKYDSKSGGIMDVLEDMKDKAEGELADLRKTETGAKNSYAMLKQSLDAEIAATTKELNDTKANKEEAGEEKASSEGDLEVTTKELKGSGEKQDTVQSDCQTVAADHQANVAARILELKTIDEAEKILRETTGGGAASFLQVAAAASSKVTQRLTLAKKEVIKMVQNLAKEHHSSALAQLASRISAEMKYNHRGSADPFAKVKGLINSMIDKLEKEASEEATEKAYCDEQMKKTATKQGDLQDVVEKLTAKIEKSASKSGQLKEEVSELMSELSTLTKEQAEMDGIRRKENSAYVTVKKDLELGLSGVRKALSVLREFYAAPKESLLQTDDDGEQMSSLMQQAVTQPAPPQQAEKSSGAGTGIISLLEVCESDMAKNLATEDAQESDAATSYDKQTQANKVTKAEKEQDVKYKTQEFKGLDKAISELEADKATENSELSAVNEYFAKIKERCVAKPSTYEERKARRDAEVKGLQDALTSLENAALMQIGTKSSRRANLRGDSLSVD
jgi:chromosome segregation ATPase